MNAKRSPGITLAVIITLTFLLGPGTQRAEAYIDPATGSHLLSTLGIVLGVLSTGVAIGYAQIRRCGDWVLAKWSARRNPADNPE